MVKTDIRKLREQLKAANPDIYQECCALAQALGYSCGAYFAIMFMERLRAPNCTILGFYDKSNKPFLAKTDDIFAEELGMNVLEICHPDKGYRSAQFHFAGTCWTVAGINEHGLSMGMTGIPGPVLEAEGQQSLYLLASILPNCKNVPDAVDYIDSKTISWPGFSVMLGDPDGNLKLIEKNAAGMAELPLNSNGVFIHTNEILDEKLARQSPPQQEFLRQNSRNRFKNATRLSAELPRNEDGIQQFLKNTGSVGAICQKVEGALHTDVAIYFIPTEGKMVFYPGYPTDVEPETVLIKELFA